MIIQKTVIEGMYTVDLAPKTDERGYFTRVFCKEELEREGILFDIVQINRSETNTKGLIRGLHYQKHPYDEEKIVQCLRGEIYDVVADLRKDSKTYGKWVGVSLSEKNMRMVIVPKGCAHGFQTLSARCVVEYFVSQFYTPASEEGVRWDDPFFSITWPHSVVMTSAKDAAWPFLHTS